MFDEDSERGQIGYCHTLIYSRTVGLARALNSSPLNLRLEHNEVR